MRKSSKWYLLSSFLLSALCAYAANEKALEEDFGDPTPEHTIDMSGFSKIISMIKKESGDSHSYFLNSDMQIITREITPGIFSGVDTGE